MTFLFNQSIELKRLRVILFSLHEGKKMFMKISICSLKTKGKLHNEIYYMYKRSKTNEITPSLKRNNPVHLFIHQKYNSGSIRGICTINFVILILENFINLN